MSKEAWGPYVVTRDSEGRWVAAELAADEDEGNGTVCCRRILHRLNVPDDAPRSVAMEQAAVQATKRYFSHRPSRPDEWTEKERRIAADTTLSHRQVSELTGRTPRAVSNYRLRARSMRYAQDTGYGE